MASCRPIRQQAGPHNGPFEPGGSNNTLLHVLVGIDAVSTSSKYLPHLSQMEVMMTHHSRRLAGVLLIVLPTVMFGGVSILSLLIGDPTYMKNPLRQDL